MTHPWHALTSSATRVLAWHVVFSMEWIPRLHGYVTRPERVRKFKQYSLNFLVHMNTFVSIYVSSRAFMRYLQQMCIHTNWVINVISTFFCPSLEYRLYRTCFCQCILVLYKPFWLNWHSRKTLYAFWSLSSPFSSLEYLRYRNCFSQRLLHEEGEFCNATLTERIDSINPAQDLFYQYERHCQ